MKKSKAIALMLIGMIAFTYVGANSHYSCAKTTTSEPALLQKCSILVQPSIELTVVKTDFVLAETIFLPQPENNQTTTSDKGVSAIPAEVIRHELHIDPGSCI